MFECERRDIDERQRLCRPIEQGHVHPLRLPSRPPAQAGRVRVAAIELERLGLRFRAIASCHERRAEMLALQHRRIVEVDQLGGRIELQPRQREQLAVSIQRLGIVNNDLAMLGAFVRFAWNC